VTDNLIPSQPPADQLPPRIHNAYWFQAFNSVSWQIALGSPLILFARELGAPAVVLGLLSGMAALTSVLQLFVAAKAERIGYRNLMVKGWSARVAILLCMVVLPLAAGRLGGGMVVALTVLVMLGFTIMRGIATCAWMPWIATLVPKPVRGYYLSRDRTFSSIASVVALGVSGLFLFDHTSLRAYAVVFGLSFLGGATSLYFLNRIPVPVRGGGDAQPAGPPARWRELLHDAPFRRLLIFSAAVQFCALSTGPFVTIFVREEAGIPDGMILWLSAGASLLGTLGLALVRHRVDRLGSRPFFSVAFVWWTVFFATWFAMAMGWIGAPWLIAPLVLLGAGFFAALYDLALTRLLMNTVSDHPASTQYFALQSVIVSLLAGVAPILWGLLLDALLARQVPGARLGGYALFFGLQWLLLGVVFLAMNRVKESDTVSLRAIVMRAVAVATHR
jgi:MFS family permease